MKKQHKYRPDPVCSDKTKLPAGIIDKIETIARNVHEEWAKKRLDDGWEYGPVRDDLKKTHPCLIPYEELPESEKDYDRNTALSTIRMIVAMGFKIE